MDLQTKLRTLSQAAKYDVSCSSSGSSRDNTGKGLGNGHLSGICHSWSDDGRCISLLKVLLSNNCIYNCAYCVNRVSNDIQRASFSPDEIADITMNFYKRNYIEGLFLSSSVYISPDYTMEQLLNTVKKLRTVYNFNGYIHLKAIPGADFKLITEAGKYADRMSVNIELPSNDSLMLLAPQKTKESILKPMGFIKSCINEIKEESKYGKYNKLFLPAGQTTQLIVGATPEHDLSIMRLSQNLYRHFSLKRVYYSAYMPVSTNPLLPSISTKPPLLREHRLYQADWLLRFYGFDAEELLSEKHPDFDTELDPKSDWAINNLNLFPVEVNKADFKMLIRVPGIGIKSAQRIISARKMASLSYEDIKKFGVVLKRARNFVTCSGKFYGENHIAKETVRQHLVPQPKTPKAEYSKFQQISLFSYLSWRDSNAQLHI